MKKSPDNLPPRDIFDSKALCAVALFLTFLFFLFLSFVVLPSLNAQASNARLSENAHRLVIHIKREADGATASTHCSSTAVGSRTLLTATHCFMVPDGISITGFSVMGQEVTIEEHQPDGNDHSLIVISGAEFKTWAKLDQRNQERIKEADRLRFWGWPASYDRKYRQVYVASEGEILLKRPLMGGKTQDYTARTWHLDGQGFPGDSGSGVYDDRGRLVGMVTYVEANSQLTVHIQFCGLVELAFKKEQLEVIK